MKNPLKNFVNTILGETGLANKNRERRGGLLPLDSFESNSTSKYLKTKVQENLNSITRFIN
jgi:hypothetical protein